ncbi:hypothetical protein [Anaerofustis stercorihominis]|uniref:Uncharacterized protein n=1 Tax=Anaerofustis stercorihominis TaxID=214853 RepID=A0A3E3DX47_9FIRM|nr:hypothetical protein [Anaerofustis stercorihominis]RGD73823.1 hypothetical protein DW687_08585 [Anaerofustis stercorihominis]
MNIEIILFIMLLVYNAGMVYAVQTAYSRGLENGYKLSKGKEVKAHEYKTKEREPDITPVEEKYLDNLQKSWSNIDNYNGTGEGQLDID